jgi:surfeit locus 1 family protein
MNLKKTPILASILFVAAFFTLCGLGVWQLKRLEWKNEIISALDAEFNLDTAQNEIKPSDIKGDFRFKRGTLRGVLDYSAQIRIGPRTHESQPGNFIFTPLRLTDGTYVMVNRGWAPQNWVPEDETKTPEGEILITGLIRKPDDHNSFTPDNVPEKNEWYYFNAGEIAAAKNIAPISPYVLYPDPPEVFINYPLATNSRPQFKNDHLQYAIFWFTMAVVLCVIYALRFLRTS